MSREQDMLDRARSGDPAAFEALIHPHVASIRRFAYAFARRWDDADDLAQEAMIKAFRSLSSFRGTSELSTWLYAVTRSACHDYYRSRSAKARQVEDELDEQFVDHADGQEHLLLSKLSAEALWTEIRKLEPEFRVPLVLFDIEGLSYEQIARVEHVPVGTVRSRLSRARRRLAERMRAAHDSFLPNGSEPGTEVAMPSSNVQEGAAK